ncbi:restriction endonuclease subunit S [Limisphaera sp. 4302-co]|uniref:restriction endonuclease subunit S n=1 Tax=Limisphaera sp. 4302-co TaxID=3400417 RepID=UPI003C1728A6
MGGEWPTVQLGDVVQNFDSRRIPISKREREKRPGPYPYYGATGIMDYVDDYLFDGLYLLIAEDGSVERPDGKPFLQLVNGQFWVNNHAHVLRGNNDEDTKFVYYSLSTVAIRPYMSGSVQSKLSQRNLNRILIHYPPDPRDRRAIARILGTLDDKIELNRRMNETLEAMAQALFKSWFVDFDPVVVNAIRAGNPIPEKFAARAAHYRDDPDALGLPEDILRLFPARFMDSELGPIPEGWKGKETHHFAKLKGGKQLPKEHIRSKGPVPVFGGAGIMGYTSKSNADGFVITVGRVGAYCGQFFRHIGKAWINNNASMVRVFQSELGEWLYLALRNADIDVIKKGAAQPFVANSDIERLPILWPGQMVASKFSMLLSPLRGLQDHQTNESRTLADLRDALLPKLISGELRVRDVERFLKERGL